MGFAEYATVAVLTVVLSGITTFSVGRFNRNINKDEDIAVMISLAKTLQGGAGQPSILERVATVEQKSKDQGYEIGGVKVDISEIRNMVARIYDKLINGKS